MASVAFLEKKSYPNQKWPIWLHFGPMYLVPRSREHLWLLGGWPWSPGNKISPGHLWQLLLVWEGEEISHVSLMRMLESDLGLWTGKSPSIKSELQAISCSGLSHRIKGCSLHRTPLPACYHPLAILTVAWSSEVSVQQQPSTNTSYFWSCFPHFIPNAELIFYTRQRYDILSMVGWLCC